MQNAFFLFDSHNRNVYGFHDPPGHDILLKFSSISYLNNYIKSFYEDSTSISFVTQYDLHWFTLIYMIYIETQENSKNEILTTLARKRKAIYNRVFSSKKNDLESPLKKRKNQVYYQENRQKILHIFFLIGIHSMQGWTTTARHGVARKRSAKRLKHPGNLFRKSLQLIGAC